MSKFDEMITVVPRKILFDNENNQFNGFLDKNSNKGQDILKHYRIMKLNDVVIWKKIQVINNLFHIAF